VVVLATETSAQEATVMRDSATLHVKDAEDQGALAEREAQERMSRVEAGKAAVSVSSREDADDLVWKIALLEGALAEVRQAREVAEENSYSLSDMVAATERL
jgi:hypothetical protein